MDFIEFKASEENNQPLDFSDNEDENIPEKMDNFIDDTDQQGEGVSFYRQLDPENFEDYPKFPNSTKNPKVAVYEDEKPYFGKRTHSLSCMILRIKILWILMSLMALKSLLKNSKVP